MFKWLFYVKDDNYKERPHKFTDEEIKEFMSRLHIESDLLKEIIVDEGMYEKYYIKENKIFFESNGKEYTVKGNEDNTYNYCENCYEIISLNDEDPQEHLDWCFGNKKYDKEIYMGEEVMARTMSSAIEKISEYLKENLPIPEDDKWNLSFSCAESSPCWDGGSIDFNVKGVEGYELRMIFHHPDYNSEEFESWDEEELNELKMEINKSADKWASRY
jgi:hypothetical protein